MAIANFLAGIFIDIDHFFDYYLNKGFSLNIIDFYYTCIDFKFTKFYVIFHSFELSLILLLVAIMHPTNLMWWGIAIGVSQHLILDVIGNKIALKGYFFTYRLIKKFNLRRLIKHDEL